jgi:heme/copper-type cytochrome/quinol oxidase subunit 1
MWVVGHFHGFILLSIVTSGFAVLYIMIPMMTGRSWYSSKLMRAHFYGYLVGALMVVLGFDELGLTGLIRRAETYPLSQTFVTGELMTSVGAVIADVATVLWLVNLVLALVKGSVVNVDSITASANLVMQTSTTSFNKLEKRFIK